MKDFTPFEIALIVLLFIVLLISIIIFNDAKQCEQNTFTYAAENLKKAVGVEIECSCYAVNTYKVFKPMYFNSTSVWFGNKYEDFLNKV